MGAEPMDLVAMEFDISRRHVCVRIGGPGLFEQLEEADGASLEGEPEEED
jgi:hypothetical protein